MSLFIPQLSNIKYIKVNNLSKKLDLERNLIIIIRSTTCFMPLPTTKDQSHQRNFQDAICCVISCKKFQVSIGKIRIEERPAK